MERKVRFAGYEFSVQSGDGGLHLNFASDPDHRQAQSEVFQLVDQLRTVAKRSGISSSEIMAYWVKNEIRRWNPIKKL